MIAMEILSIFFALFTLLGHMVCGKTVDYRNAFDRQLYKSVLDKDKCHKQLEILTNYSLGLRFLDATGRLPIGLLEGNLQDLGDYFECISINQVISDIDIQGKYCALQIPVQQKIIDRPPAWMKMASRFISRSFTDNTKSILKAAINSHDNLKDYYNEFLRGRFNVSIILGVCIPHACTTQQVIDFFAERHVSMFNISYTESYCRLANDKPFSMADYIAVVVFSALGAITIVSTSYDIYNVLILKRDQSRVKKIFQSFSVYTNTRRLVTFTKNPEALECVDGIRALSMLLVVIGHTYCTMFIRPIHNLKYLDEWARWFSTTWLNAAPITVDTFFFLSGMLSVYSTVGKFTRDSFVKHIHLYYLHRLLRMFPLLAAVVLLQASFLHHAGDGPYWTIVAGSTEACKKFWWSTLLHIQNIVNPIETCIAPSWYLSVDVQLYILSPLLIFWMFGKKFTAWLVLSVALVFSLIVSTYYSFKYNFGAAIGNPDHIVRFFEYFREYYTNTLIRTSPFLVGMAYGYLMHLFRDKILNISRVKIGLLWVLSLLTLAFCVVCIYPTMQRDNGLQIYENILNSYMRAVWACGLGWVVFACVKGYGGPINWFLSLHLWKLPARLSYGVYLLHVPLMIVVEGSSVKSYYFSDSNSVHRFLSDATMTFMASFFLTVLVDSPFSTLQKMLLAGKKLQTTTLSEKPKKTNQERKFYKTSL